MNDTLSRAHKTLFWGGIAFMYGSVVALLTGPVTDLRIAAFASVFLAGGVVSLFSIFLLLPRTGTSVPRDEERSAETFTVEIRRKALSAFPVPAGLGLLFVLTPPVLELLALTPDQPRGLLFWVGVALLAATALASRVLARAPGHRLTRFSFFLAAFLAPAAGLVGGMALVAVSTFS